MRPLIVTAAVILDLKGHMLLGRKPGSEQYGPPGGKLDEDEQLKQGCVRELREETGLKAKIHDLVELGFCERKDKHQLVFWYWVALYQGTPRVMEPDKCTGWYFMPFPPNSRCIPGMRLFREKLLGVLDQVSGIKVAA
jgi:8-oxo-dGTP diphosphatase